MSVLAVADGQGGRAGGGSAARLACQTCRELSSAASFSSLLKPQTWSRLLTETDRVVAADPAAGFTTLAALALEADRLAGASSGDSAVVLLTAKKPGIVLTFRQKKNPPVGSGSACFVGFEGRLHPPWLLLAMSDGVWKYAGMQNVLTLSATTPAEQICQELLARARLPKTGGLQDDFTLVALGSPIASAG